MRKYLLLDLFFFGGSPFVALLIRENFESPWSRLDDVVPFAGILVAVAAVVLVATGANRSLWRFTSSSEVPRLLIAVTLSLLLALFFTFAVNRLDGVSRSVPLIQWFLVVGGMLLVRFSARWRMLARRRRYAAADDVSGNAARNVIVLGLNEIAELYLRSVEVHAASGVRIAGVMARQNRHRGRTLRTHNVLGSYDELRSVLAKLEVHGVFVDCVVVAEPFDDLEPEVQKLLLDLDRSGRVAFEFIVETLGLIASAGRQGRIAERLQSLDPPAVVADAARGAQAEASAFRTAARAPLGLYGAVKRILDIVAALVLIVLTLPLFLFAAVAVAVDVGMPLLFWQQRRGLHRQPFKLWKFRTMLAAHDEAGRRIPDGIRVSRIGHTLRRCRFDELPQLFGVLQGELSFVGPRPLLPVDQPCLEHVRFSVRPGLTGWAQINGGRHVSVDERAALDAWYVRHASLWVDMKIALGTVRMLVLGDTRNEGVIVAARAEADGRVPESSNHGLTLEEGIPG